ncbi:hypothetical protein AKO1_002646 [Acrasis kona]|uniref:Nucleolar protein 12 n=1 Tax=Acrasis kona TaxID=1008807 RepID=A0AAW2ZN61_9EUKA
MVNQKRPRVNSVSFDSNARKEYITGQRKKRDTNRVIAQEIMKQKEYHAKLDKRKQKREDEKRLVERVERRRQQILRGKSDYDSGSDADDFGFGSGDEESDSIPEIKEPQTITKTYELDEDSDEDLEESEPKVDNITVVVEPLTFDNEEELAHERKMEFEEKQKEKGPEEPSDKRKTNVDFTKKQIEKKIKQMHKEKYNTANKKQGGPSGGISKSGIKYKRKREKVMKRVKKKEKKRAARKGK